MKRSGAMMQVSMVALLVALAGLGAGGLYTVGSSGLNPTAIPSTASTPFIGANLPRGYVAASLLPNSPSYPCPSNYNSTQCAAFKSTCGNGVCDPNETCGSCPVDCGVPQGLSCDPYTGRASGLGGICEQYIQFSNVTPNPITGTCQTPGGCPTSTSG